MFDIINDILVKKSGKSLDRSDFSEEFNLYMIQRWISMKSDLNVEILNATVNILYGSLSNEEHYKLMEEIMPMTNSRKRYIKATRKEKSKKQDSVDVSQTFEESSAKIDESLKEVLGEKYNGWAFR